MPLFTRSFASFPSYKSKYSLDEYLAAAAFEDAAAEDAAAEDTAAEDAAAEDAAAAAPAALHTKKVNEYI